MQYSTAYDACGCSSTRVLYLSNVVCIGWIRCSIHYVPEVDDPKIHEAAINRRQHEEQLYMEAMKFFHGGK